MKTYDLAISFAGEQRSLARAITRQLNPLGYQVFYDAYHINQTFGSKLPQLLHEVYSHTNCIAVLVSAAYVSNPYTLFEQQAILQNYIHNPQCRILPVIVEKADIPGFPNTIGAVSYDGDVHVLCAYIASVLGVKPAMETIDGHNEVRQIMEICFRRAIFTSMAEEISTPAMFRSIESCIAQLNRLLPGIRIPELSQFVNSLVLDLNDIDRYSAFPADWSCKFEESDKVKIDALKVSIIDKLHYLNSRFGTRIDLPMDIGLGYPFKYQNKDFAFVDQ